MSAPLAAEQNGAPLELVSAQDTEYLARAPAVSGYIVGPWFDHLLIIWTPVIWLLLGGLVAALEGGSATFPVFGRPLRLTETFVVALMFAHLFSTVFRSHLNGHFFRARLSRTTIGPLIVAVILGFWDAAWMVFPILVILFDIWHSALQTFGFGRIYDARIGNDVSFGRWWDKGLAVLVYAGPLFGGLNVFWYLSPFRLADGFTNAGGTRVLEGFVWYGREIATALTVVGGIYLILYVAAYARRARAGYKVSWNKVLLYVSLTTTTVLSFGFNTFDQAYLISESFHATQYLAFLGWSEQPNLSRRLKMEGSRLGVVLPWVLILGTSFGLGLFVAANWQTKIGVIFILVVGAAHYWCDGFIWSVRKGDV